MLDRKILGWDSGCRQGPGFWYIFLLRRRNQSFAKIFLTIHIQTNQKTWLHQGIPLCPIFPANQSLDKNLRFSQLPYFKTNCKRWSQRNPYQNYQMKEVSNHLRVHSVIGILLGFSKAFVGRWFTEGLPLSHSQVSQKPRCSQGFCTQPMKT